MTPDLTRARWRKSSRSHSGGNCIEVATVPFAWRKSSRSTTGGNCVEVAPAVDAVAVRDSKDPSGPVLNVAPRSWTSFLATIARS